MGRFRILLVDDEEDFVTTLAERLGKRDLRSEVALDGESALARTAVEPPDVMVLDFRMPGIDGLEVLRRVKAAYPSVLVIMLSGHGSVEAEAEARRMGVFEYLRKPVDIEEIARSLRRARRESLDSCGAAREGAKG